MRRWTAVLVSACLAATLGAPGIAMAAGGKGEPTDDPTLTWASEQAWREATLEKEAEMAAASGSRPVAAAAGAGSIAAATATYGLHTLSATNYKQETTYYCGPASARQSLSWHKARSGSGASLPSQSTLAGRIGTTSSGSLTTGIARALNSYNGTFGAINYVASNLTDTGSPKTAFYTRIGWMIQDARTVPIILTSTHYIPRYAGRSSRHYMSVSGIDDRTSTILMRSVDPNYDSRYRGVYWDRMGSTSSDGLCRACYQADVEGSNLAMCW